MIDLNFFFLKNEFRIYLFWNWKCFDGTEIEILLLWVSMTEDSSPTHLKQMENKLIKNDETETMCFYNLGEEIF